MGAEPKIKRSLEQIQEEIEKRAVVTVTLNYYPGAHWDLELRTIRELSNRGETLRAEPRRSWEELFEELLRRLPAPLPETQVPDEKKPRSLSEVIDRMLEAIPEEEGSLRWELHGIKNAVSYQAPEIHGHYWRQVVALLGRMIGEPKAEWEKKVSSIFKGEL